MGKSTALQASGHKPKYWTSSDFDLIMALDDAACCAEEMFLVLSYLVNPLVVP